MTTDHPVETLGTNASVRGCKDLHGSTSARVQTPPAKGTVQRGKRQGRVSATIHDKKVGADRGSLRSRSGYHVNNHLGHCAEGRREVDETVRTEPQHTFEWQHGPCWTWKSQEGIIKAAVKPVVHSFMETGTFTESQPCEEETDEPNDQLGEEEELCPHLEEAMAASWIAQIGEEDHSETEAVGLLHCHERAAQTNLGSGSGGQEGSTKGFVDSSHHVQQFETERMVPRQLKQSMRRSPNPMDGDGTPKDLRARLRKENRCFRCKKKGPWKAECPEKQHNKDGTAPAVFSGLTFFAHCE